MTNSKATFIEEPARRIPIMERTQVLVVGGGPAGCAAAIAAKRAGAERVVLMERYGYLGGMSTGGNVILIPSLSYGKEIIIRGLMLEVFERVSQLPGGACGPLMEDVGSRDPALVEQWQDYLNMVWNGTVCYGGFVDPHLLKLVWMKTAAEAGVRLCLHSWASQVTVKEGNIQEVIFESKQGRQAIHADVVIDCTGDADVCAQAGAAVDYVDAGPHRASSLGLVYRLYNADYRAFSAYRLSHEAEWAAHAQQLQNICGYATTFFPGSRNDIVWADNWVLGHSSLQVQGLTQAERDVQLTILPVIAYLQDHHIPGLEHVRLMDIASQLGVRGSRRVLGDYVLTMDDVMGRSGFDDVIAVFPAVDVVTTDGGTDDSSSIGPMQIPLRALLVKDFSNLMVAGRSFSSDRDANNLTNLIPHCAAMGQAAGAAAALACREQCAVRQVPVARIQQELRRQNVYLPR